MIGIYSHVPAAGRYRGLVELTHITTAHESYADATRREKQWQFEVHTPARVFILRAPSEAEMLMWLSEINDAVTKLHRSHVVKTVLRDDSSSSSIQTAPLESAENDFDRFGAPDGEPISNKESILQVG